MLSVKLQTSSQMLQPIIRREGKLFKVNFVVTPTNVNSPGNANPYVAGGDLLDLTQLFNLLSSSPGQVLPSFEFPLEVRLRSQPNAPGPAALYVYRFCVGTALNNGTMQVLTGAAAQSGLTELAAGNYPAGVLADVIVGTAEFLMP